VWGLRARADDSAPGYPVVVFGGRHADVPITAEMGAALGRMIACEVLVCVVDLSELGSKAARRRFMAEFSERFTRRTRSLCIWCSTKRICGRRSGRCPIRPASWVTSKKSCAAGVCAASSRGNGRPPWLRKAAC
jgi:hypothetical protein